ncbi:MAG: hypothetical protein ACK58T_26535, partial [Phycisphaerae bacterium]
MALPSQTERQTEIGRSYVLNQKNAASGGAKLVVGVAAALILVAGTIWGIVSFVNRKSTTGTLPSETTTDQPRALAGSTPPPPAAIKETLEPASTASQPATTPSPSPALTNATTGAPATSPSTPAQT